MLLGLLVSGVVGLIALGAIVVGSASAGYQPPDDVRAAAQLRADLENEFPYWRFETSVVSDGRLVVVVLHRSFRDLGEEEAEERAVELATFAASRYDRVDGGFTGIDVQLTTRIGIGTLQWTNPGHGFRFPPEWVENVRRIQILERKLERLTAEREAPCPVHDLDAAGQRPAELEEE